MSFGGVPAAQKLQDYYLWEVILNEYPHLRAIVEIGTWRGGFACFLAAQASLRGLHFRTYDVHEPVVPIAEFVQMDVFRYAEDVGALLRDWEPLILFCDGGNKPRELQTFSPYLGPESVMIVHDWGTEMSIREMPESLEMVHGDFCDEIRSMSRVFRVKDV